MMKKINFITLLTIILSLVLASSVYATDFEPYREKIPRIVFIEPEGVAEIVAGEDFNLTIDYKNDSSHNAYDIRMTPLFEDMPLVYERPVVFERTKTLKARDSGTVSFSFKAADDAALGVYGLKFKIEYTNVRDENYDTEQIIYFKVVKEKVKPIIEISDILTGESGVFANSTFPLNFVVSNKGEIDANNVEVTLKGLSPDTFMAVDSKNYKYVGELKNGGSINVSFNMFASEKINKGLNTITAEIKYKDTSGNELSTEKIIYILDVKSENEVVDEDGSLAKPKIIISSYSTVPKSIIAGDEFNFNFTFKNTSKEKNLRNMKITLSATDGAFIITKGSNTFYIEELAANDVMAKSIGLKAKQDLSSNSYPIILSFDYEDSAGAEYVAEEKINIPVTEYSKLVINSVYANEGYVNSNTSLAFDYINMGRAVVSNLTASVEGDYVAVQPINYIGNLNAGSSDYYDIEITPTKSGANYGTLVLAFEDSSGKIIEVRKEFEGFAMEEFSFDEPTFDPEYMYPGMVEPMEEEEVVSTWTIVGYGFGAFLITFFITKIITTKIVRKKLEDEI